MRLFPKDRDLSRAPEKVEIPVRASDFRLRPDELSFRLDAFLQHHLHWRSRTSIQRLIQDGYVLVAPAERAHAAPAVERRPGRRVRHGSSVVVVIPEELRLDDVRALSGELVILYEDERVLAVDKPPNIAVHPSGRHLSDTLIQRLHALFRERYGDNRHFLKLCHRLDLETSGVVLSAKDAEAHRFLMGAFENRRVEKEYLALVWGAPEEDAGVVDYPLGPSRTSRVGLKMACVPDGAPSRTEWRVVERGPVCSVLSCRPTTGRQHQIRVHLEAIGHPLVGDKLYGDDEELFLKQIEGSLSADERRRLGLPRHALHNHRLVVPRPGGGEPLAFESPLADDLRRFFAAENARAATRG